MSSPTDNPYAAPAEAEIAYAPFPPGESAKEVFLAWERLRVIYNLILVGVSLLVGMARLTELSFWYFLIEGAVGANLCFCVGPVVEGYLTLIGINRDGSRMLLFVLGTIASCLVAAAAISASLLTF